jgi:hypothetical protein
VEDVGGDGGDGYFPAYGLFNFLIVVGDVLH